MRSFLSYLLLTLILIGWVIVNLSVHDYGQKCLKDFEKYPIIIFSRDTKLLKELSETLNDSMFVKELKLEERNELSDKLLDKYSLGNARRYLDIEQLPDVLTIRFLGNERSIEGRKEILLNLGKYSNRIVVRYNEESWQQIMDDYNIIKSFRAKLNIALIFAITCFVFVTRMLQEISTTESIKRKMKLNTLLVNKRKSSFFELILFTVIPIGLALCYYNLILGGNGNIFNTADYIIVTLVYVIANSLVMIFSDRNYD